MIDQLALYNEGESFQGISGATYVAICQGWTAESHRLEMILSQLEPSITFDIKGTQGNGKNTVHIIPHDKHRALRKTGQLRSVFDQLHEHGISCD